MTESHVWPADKLAAAAEFARRVFGEHVDVTRPEQQLVVGGRRNGRATFRRMYLDNISRGAEAVDAGERTPPPLVYHVTANVVPLERVLRSTGEQLSRMFVAGTRGFGNGHPVVPAEWFRPPPPAVVPLCLAGPRHESRCAGGTREVD